MTSAQSLAALYGHSHDLMRNLDGLQPQEAFDELLKYLYFKERTEEIGELTHTRGYSLGPADSTDSRRVRAVRQHFRQYLKADANSARHLWPNGQFKLSDACLDRIDQLFDPIRFRELGVDTRSAALREFLHADIRKGLGIFLTPDTVVQTIVACIAPHRKQAVLDPACGSGTFLIETVKYWQKHEEWEKSLPKIYGVDKNPRMLMLAELNLADQPSVQFVRALGDSIAIAGRVRMSANEAENGFDVVLTNPPFGVYVDAASDGYVTHDSARSADDALFGRQQSEAIFLEQCLRLLKPGGQLGIVLPRSVFTNQTDRLERARVVAGSLGYIEAVISLPPETFYRTGAQTNTVVLLARRYRSEEERLEKHRTAYIRVTNVGFDSTGRARADSELDAVPGELMELREGAERTSLGFLGLSEAKSESFKLAPSAISGRQRTGATGLGGHRLGDLVEVVRTGRTPARSAYTDSGLFVVKVGNLTGAGLDWLARDRNFVDSNEGARRAKAELLLRPTDIVLTSSAHSPVYIGKKVDLIGEIPSWVGGSASFVGEVMLVRAKSEVIDPFALLAFLRLPSTHERLQGLARGQTAHLHPDDVKGIVVPKEFVDQSDSVKRLTSLLQREIQLKAEMNEIAHLQAIAQRALGG